eukprot:scaffold1319_cov126-Cylindrotheca_fusiformis.AAC.3
MATAMASRESWRFQRTKARHFHRGGGESGLFDRKDDDDEEDGLVLEQPSQQRRICDDDASWMSSRKRPRPSRRTMSPDSSDINNRQQRPFVGSKSEPWKSCSESSYQQSPQDRSLPPFQQPHHHHHQDNNNKVDRRSMCNTVWCNNGGRPRPHRYLEGDEKRNDASGRWRGEPKRNTPPSSRQEQQPWQQHRNHRGGNDESNIHNNNWTSRQGRPFLDAPPPPPPRNNNNLASRPPPESYHQRRRRSFSRERGDREFLDRPQYDAAPPPPHLNRAREGWRGRSPNNSNGSLFQERGFAQEDQEGRRRYPTPPPPPPTEYSHRNDSTSRGRYLERPPRFEQQRRSSTPPPPPRRSFISADQSIRSLDDSRHSATDSRRRHSVSPPSRRRFISAADCNKERYGNDSMPPNNHPSLHMMKDDGTQSSRHIHPEPLSSNYNNHNNWRRAERAPYNNNNNSNHERPVNNAYPSIRNHPRDDDWQQQAQQPNQRDSGSPRSILAPRRDVPQQISQPRLEGGGEHSMQQHQRYHDEGGLRRMSTPPNDAPRRQSMANNNDGDDEGRSPRQHRRNERLLLPTQNDTPRQVSQTSTEDGHRPPSTNVGNVPPQPVPTNRDSMGSSKTTTGFKPLPLATKPPVGKSTAKEESPSTTANEKVVKSDPPPPKKPSLAIPSRWLKPVVKAKKPRPPAAAVSASVSKSKTVQPQKVIPRKVQEKKKEIASSSSCPTSPSLNNRLVTDSEGGSTISNNLALMVVEHNTTRDLQRVPSAIVTKPSPKVDNNNNNNTEDDMFKSDNEYGVKSPLRNTTNKMMQQQDQQDSCSSDNTSDDSSDDSDTDDEEVMMWASKMFGIPVRPSPTKVVPEPPNSSAEPPRKKLRLKLKIPRPQSEQEFVQSSLPNTDAVKKKKKKKRKGNLENRSAEGNVIVQKKKQKKRGRPKKKTCFEMKPQTATSEEETNPVNQEEERMRKESAKPLTAAQIKEILGEDAFYADSAGTNWVRRSVRQPSKALLNAKPVRDLVEKLKTNHPDMVVLKMKKFVNDPNAPSVVIDAALDALEENTNCQSLYIQNFNEGMRDDQVLHLLKILQHPKCNIWCLNIGENYNVKTRTWDKFTKGLQKTKITHMYASEHTITTEMKDEIRATIRNNRAKHDMHINPDNLHVIVQCTHCWWNPINAKVLRPYLKKEGFEHILKDKEAQGLRGSSSAAPSV